MIPLISLKNQNEQTVLILRERRILNSIKLLLTGQIVNNLKFFERQYEFNNISKKEILRGCLV